MCCVSKKENHNTCGLLFACFLGSLSRVSDTVCFLYNQGTEKTEESGENEAQKKDEEDAGNLTESQEKNVSVCFFHRSFIGFISIHQVFMELLPGASNPSGHTGVSMIIRS